MKAKTNMAASDSDTVVITNAGAASAFCIPETLARHCHHTVVESVRPLRGGALKRFIKRAVCLARCVA
ncbi:MAG: hypothetical protein LBH93_05980 [Chitinispirillales bacterium]|jgi:hypothetical protein|nr:hypothetical protein [Chitinispirillales bacterium]